MKPPSFQYHKVQSIEEGLQFLGEHQSRARLLAGGQSLVPQLNQRTVDCSVLIDLNSLSELQEIRVTNDLIQIGPMTRQASLEKEPNIRSAFPEFAQLLPYLGFSPTRNRGTIGGSLAFADPAAELPALLLALGATVEIQSAARVLQVLTIDEFLLGPYKTVLQSDEMITRIMIPRRKEHPNSFVREVNVRATGRALAGIVAFANEASINATFFGWNDRPRKIEITAETSHDLSDESLVELLENPSKAPLWHSDPHGTADYRRFVFCSLLRKAIEKLAA